MSGASDTDTGPMLQLVRAMRRTTAQPQVPARQFYLLLPIYVLGAAVICLIAATLIGQVLTIILPVSAVAITSVLMILAVLTVGWSAETAINRLDLPGRFGFRARRASTHH